MADQAPAPSLTPSPASSPAASPAASPAISPPLSDISDISDEECPIINWTIVTSELSKLPKIEPTKNTHRIIKLNKHVKKIDSKYKNMDMKLNKLIQEMDGVKEGLNDVKETLAILMDERKKDRKYNKAKNYNVHNKMYNGFLRGNNAKLHGMLILESDNDEEIGNPIPNAPDEIQDFGNLTIAQAEKILEYLEFQNPDSLRRNREGRVLNIAAIKINMQNAVRREYGFV